ncbi:MAG: hypothetical protein HKP25_14910 [Marinicaulis sp.]|nr:hypothetical protein [Marinicaulis sp.]NNL90352.1 hypothetical protein [Marinicaulis sp.]
MIRRKDAPHISKTFKRKTEAESWARQIEIDADRGHLKHDPQILNRITLGDILKRYLTSVSCDKAGKRIEAYVINGVLKESLSKRTLASLGPSDFAA